MRSITKNVRRGRDEDRLTGGKLWTKETRNNKQRKKTHNPREGWENGTPPPHAEKVEMVSTNDKFFWWAVELYSSTDSADYLGS